MGDPGGWRKSSHSASMGDCAEVRSCSCGVAVRDSRDPAGPVLVFPGSTWGAFLRDLRRG